MNRQIAEEFLGTDYRMGRAWRGIEELLKNTRTA